MQITYGINMPEDYRNRESCLIEQMFFKYSKVIAFYTYGNIKNFSPTGDTVAIFKVKPKP